MDVLLDSFFELNHVNYNSGKNVLLVQLLPP